MAARTCTLWRPRRCRRHEICPPTRARTAVAMLSVPIATPAVPTPVPLPSPPALSAAHSSTLSTPPTSAVANATDGDWPADAVTNGVEQLADAGAIAQRAANTTSFHDGSAHGARHVPTARVDDTH